MMFQFVRAGLALAMAAVWRVAAADPASQKIPFKRESVADGAASPGVAVTIVILAIIAIGVLYWLRNRLRVDGSGAPARAARVLESHRLGPRATLAVVEFGGQRLLLAHSEQGVQCVASTPIEGPGNEG